MNDLPSFQTTVSEYEPELGTTTEGVPYVCLRDANVRTEYETIVSTVMAFGPAAEKIAETLAEHGDAAIRLDLRHSDAILKVADEDVRIAA